MTPLKQQASIDYGIQAAVAHLKDASIGVPILTNINIGLEGEIDLATLRYYSLTDSQHDKLLKDGDVLFNWRSGSATHVGKTALFELKHQYTFSSFILRFRPTNHVSSRYLTWFFRFMHASGFFSFRRDQSSVNSVINASSAAELPVAFPASSFEQAAIVEQIEAANAKIAAEEDRKTALAALFKSMLHQLMTGQIRLLSDEGLPVA